MVNVELNKENSFKGTAVIVGVLFLIQMIAASVSYSAILTPILRANNIPLNISAHSTKVTVAMLLDLITGLSVFGISVLLFPLLKRYDERIALWYFGLRLNEWVCATISGIFLLTVISVSKDYAATSTRENPYLQSLVTYLLHAAGVTKTLMLLGFCFSAVLFYYLLLKSKLLPAFISVWGLIGVILLLPEVLANIFGYSLGGIIIMLPMGLNEIFLGIWLIVKGFNKSVITAESKIE
jgi:hypothetical protein